MQKAICDASFTGHRTYLKLASVQEKQSNAILLASEVRCRKDRLDSPLSLYGAADTDVVVMDQPSLLIGFGIASAAREGGPWRSNFR
jgi:hypothetical protein